MHIDIDLIGKGTKHEELSGLKRGRALSETLEQETQLKKSKDELNPERSINQENMVEVVELPHQK